jgi:phosphate transport system protein
MGETRWRFHQELEALEREVQQTGAEARRLLAKALQALVDVDLRACEEVVRGDDEVDRLYLDVEQRILGLFALQTPVASDLRLLTALLHINLHLERIADQAVNLAKITCLVEGLPSNPKSSAASRRWEGWHWGWSAPRWTPLPAATSSWHAGSPSWTTPSTS